ncbi:MAG: hypothetical protein IPF94_20615 [Betaproteobacteria bacterium]|nr:hypothetical protein [Betaproteobacteria bacterium]
MFKTVTATCGSAESTVANVVDELTKGGIPREKDLTATTPRCRSRSWFPKRGSRRLRNPESARAVRDFPDPRGVSAKVPAAAP